MDDGAELLALRAEVERLLAAALAANHLYAADRARREEGHAEEIERRDAQHVAETERRDKLHVDETDRRDQLHQDEQRRRSDLHDHEMEMLRVALESRDIIGQAKGVIMSSLGCSPEEAFVLLRQQSQHENRKLSEVAAEIAERAHRRPSDQ